MPAPKRIVVTGVSRGLGQPWSTASSPAATSCSAVPARRRRSPNCASATRPRTASPWSTSTRDDEVRAWAAEVLSGGPPDLLVNNAATINRNAPLWKVPAEEFSRVIDVNIKGVVNVIRHFLPAMIERRSRRGRQLQLVVGAQGAAEVAPYCATKWAIEGLTRAMAAELPRGMAAVPVIPGIIDTAMLRSCFGADAANYPDPAAWAEKAVPFLLGLGPKDNGKPMEVPE